MKDFVDFLTTLASAEVWFRNDEGRLRYQGPQGALIPLLRTSLAEHREDLLSLLAASGPGWKRFSLPSRGQKALWFEHRLDPSSAAYNVALAARILSPPALMDARRLERSLQRCLDRHAALRVTFPEWKGEPVQLVDERQSLTFDRIDAEGWSAQQLESRLAQELARPFDLVRGPLFRTLFFDRSDCPWLILTIHHIVFDLWSFRALLDDLGAFYDSETGDGTGPSPLTFEYPDYVLWQERELAGPRGEQLWSYWREHLSDTPAPLELPTDRPRPPFRSGRGATLLFSVGEALTASLREVSRERGLTLYSTVLAGFLALLHRYTGQADLIVGSAVAGRSLPALEPLVGYFVNMLVLRSDLRGAPSFEELAAAVGRTVAGALDHQDFPFPLLVERLGLPRTGRSPVYDVTYALQPAHVDLRGGQAGSPEVAVRAGSLELELIEVPQQQGQTDLSLRLFDRGATLAGWLQYDPDLFDAATASRWRQHLEALLAAAVASPKAGLGDLGLLSSAERHQLLVEWNDTAGQIPRIPPREETLAEAFAARVAATPDAVAVVFGSAVLTYAGLDARAERVARRLARLGVGCDDRVGLVAGRSLEMVVGLLGVIKAGAGYVALSPEDPPERLGDLLADAGVGAILTQEALRDRLDEVWRRCGRPVLGLDLDLESDRDDPTPPVPRASALPSSLAYIAFTSGSSGRPKGVAVPQRAVLRLVRDDGFADLGPGQVFLQLSPLAFDASTLEVWGPLLNGGRLVVMPPGTPSLEEVAEAVERHGVTLLWLTAGLFHAMVEGPLERLASLRQLVAGGDALSPRHVRETLARLPGLRLVNGYGPTENTTFTCCGAVAGPVDTDRPVPLGRPIADTRVVLLDEDGRPVPLGAAGELHAGGDGLARGYWGQPDRTAERFVPDPFSGSPGARLYRTGDRARFLPDGRVEFLGRQDRQVKIRGFRVEPGEVEAALGGHPGVAEAAVDTRLDAAGDRVLVAWVVPRAEAPGTTEELRSWLASRLPAALVPSAILSVEALPRTPNGKVDRRALPTPAWGGAGSAEDRRPLTPSEELAAAVWTDVLGLDRVGPQDDFFGLGGHSLLAVRVLSRVRSTLGVELSIRDLLESPTLAGFAGRLREALAERAAGEPGVSRPATRPRGLEGLPLSFAQQRLWFLDQLEGGSPLYNIAASFQLEGVLSPGALIDAFAALVDRHEALRTSFRVVDGEPVQDVARGLPLHISRVDLGALPAGRRSAELARLAAEEAERPFDLGRAPLLRVRLVRLARQEHAVLLTLHHIVGDGASLDILFRELAELYDGRLRGRGSSLPEPEHRYPDFVAWQRERLQGPALEERLAPWRARLVPVPPPLDLPTDRPRPAVPDHRGRIQAFAVDAPLFGRLKDLSRREGATPFMTLLAAFAVQLGRYTGRRDLILGTPVANRDRVEWESLVGLLVNTLPLRISWQGSPSFKEILSAVREVCLEAFEHQEVPFEKIVEAVQPERNAGQTPLFQVLFTLAGLSAPPSFPGLAATPLRFASRTAKFELTLFLDEDAAGGLAGAMEYRAELFEAVTVQRMLAHLEILLAAVAVNPAFDFAYMPLMTPAESHQILLEWQGDSARYAGEDCLDGLFEAQALGSPEAVAVVFESQVLTYGQLRGRVERLARHLRSLGVGPETRVGLCLERSPGLVVAILATLRAGGAYVPLDPEHPRERLQLLLDDARPACVVTAGPAADRLPPVAAPLVRLDGPELPESSGKTRVDLPDRLAYVLYTSGSTGRPKGAMNSHRAVRNRILWMQEAYGLTPEDAVLQKTPFSFDVSVWEFLWPLVTGARLVLARPGGHRDPGYLAGLIRQERVTTLHFVPSMLEIFLEEADAAACGSLARVFCSGEALPRRLVERFHERLRAELHNLYGPTEAAVDVTAWPCPPGRGPVPIGRPIANLGIHLLDADLGPVPIGVPGELYIAGAGVGRGYLEDPARTAERFVPDPLSAEPGARLYRTGDLARRLPGGEVEYLGRLDHQVKIRGHRIELGEVEAALERHPAVRACVAVCQDGPRLVAYAVVAGEPRPAVNEIRDFLRERLPEPMIPAQVMLLDALPLLANGKVDRKALPTPGQVREEAAVPPRGALETMLAGLWREVLGLDAVGVRENFFDLGGHSLLLPRLRTRIRETLDRDVPLLHFFRYPTVESLARRIGTGADSETGPVRPAGGGAAPDVADIAIVGMAARFPGAQDLNGFWRNLRDGVEAISRFSAEELAAAGVDPRWTADPAYVPAAAVIEGEDLFDAGFFGINPREADLMDPQHRVFLECCWHALEDAGLDPQGQAGATGVFAGAGPSDYFERVRAAVDASDSMGVFQAGIGNRPFSLATQVAYRLGLRGPALFVDTACSTSLVAVHLACQSLRNGECGLALAGGAAIAVPQRAGHLYQEAGILSPDGHCRAFDAEAAGTVRGNGAGAVVLKRLADALADGDPVRAVIRGTAVNNDGSLKIGYTAPSIEGQAEAIARAQAVAGVDAASIGVVEAHGTGTALGDPVEVAALLKVFGSGRPGSCALGSVKTNLGHLDAAAGVAGLIKTVLSLEHRQIPSSLHFQRPNPEIDLESGPFYVNTALRDWPAGDGPRRAGVSSFGIGGTNAHAVVEEAPALPQQETGTRDWQVLVLSARTASALETAAANLANHLDQDLADTAYTLQTGRSRLPHRLFLLARSPGEARAALVEGDPKRRVTAFEEGRDRPVVFLFPGGGAQHAGMGRELYRSEAVFRREIDHCAELFAPHLGRDLRELLYPSDEANQADEAAEESARLLGRTTFGLPALFATEYALARLWLSWNVVPQAMIGHSLGEYTAACLAGVLSPADAAAVVALRGRLFDTLPEGGMLSVSAAAAEMRERLAPELSLAAANAPGLCVVSGPVEALERLRGELAGEGVEVRRVPIAVAAHSGMVEPILGEFERFVASLDLSPPRIPYVSNVTGTWIRSGEATDPAYWARHLRQTVRFADGIRELLGDPSRVLLEVGPGSTLSTLARQGGTKGSRVAAVPSMRSAKDGEPDDMVLMGAVGRLWLAGVAVDWRAVHGGPRRRVRLPGYPFERTRHWIEPRIEPRIGSRRPEVADWFYVPVWKRLPAPPRGVPPEPGEGWLLFVDDLGLGARLAARLRGDGAPVVSVARGEGFARLDEGVYAVAPGCRGDYEALLRELAARSFAPHRIVHLWTVTPDAGGDLEGDQENGLFSLLFLLQALGESGSGERVDLHVVSSGLRDVVDGDAVAPGKATLLGVLKVAPQELPHVACRSLDLKWPAEPEAQRRVVDQISAELAAGPVPGTVGAVGAVAPVAFRGRHRWVEDLERLALPVPGGLPARLRRGGVYLITGGLGGLGLEVAERLARDAAARLVLLGRSGLPPRDRWAGLRDGEDETSRRIRRVLALEEAGAEVLVVAADVTDLAAMERVRERILERFGELHGIFHAAGLAGGGALQLRSPDELRRELAPRVQGTLVLDGLARRLRADFLVLFSSLSATVGAVGQVGYCAGNSFADAWARSRAAQEEGPWTVAVAWDRWQGLGMATAVEELHFGITGERLAGGIRGDEGWSALCRILEHGGLPQVVVSPLDVPSLLKEAATAPVARFLEPASGTPSSGHSRVAGSRAAPRNDAERCIAAIWSELLGIEDIGIHDNFLELGGHSLLGTRMIARLRRQLQVEIPLRSFFEAPTVAELAAIVTSTAASPPPERIGRVRRESPEELLAGLDRLSDDEMGALLDELLYDETAG